MTAETIRKLAENAHEAAEALSAARRAVVELMRQGKPIRGSHAREMEVKAQRRYTLAQNRLNAAQDAWARSN